MYKVEIIKKPIFINKPDFDSYINRTDKEKCLIGFPKKTRGTCLKGVMKNSKCYHITLDEEYLKELKETFKTINKVYLPSIIRYMFEDERTFIQNTLSHHPVFNTVNGKYNVYGSENDIHTDTYTGSTYEFDMYKVNDFELCPKTKIEEDKIRTEEQRKSIEKLNVTCLKDTIVAALEQAGIKTTLTQRSYLHHNRAFIQAVDKKEWNKLLLIAINTYLNNIAKEHGFKVAMPKIKSNAKINEYCPLFFLDDLEIIGD